MSERYGVGDTIRVLTQPLADVAGVLQTGLGDVLLKIQRASDGFWLDFNDNTFKAAAWVDIDQVMTELDAVQAAGVYYYDFDSTGFGDQEYYFTITSATAVNDPQTSTAIVGGIFDDLQGLLHKNSVIDEVVNNGGGFLTSARVRQFVSAAAASAATPGAANGADSEIHRWRITAAPTIAGGTLLNDFTLVEEL